MAMSFLGHCGDSVPGHLNGEMFGTHTTPTQTDVTLDMDLLSAYLQPLNDPAGVR